MRCAALTASTFEVPDTNSAKVSEGSSPVTDASALIGMAATHRQAVEMAAQKRPGLILADIQLADGSSGLEAVNELLKTFEVPVVFITAYPERFLTGERPEPAFLISKPFQSAMVSAVASQALFFQRNSRNRAPKAAAS